MYWYLKALKNFIYFKGRAQRKEYWTFVLVNVLISVVLLVIQLSIGLDDWLTRLFSYLVFLPSTSALVRRLHDTGRSGKWIFIGLVPIIGQIVLIVFACFDSEDHENKWGPNPKGEEHPPLVNDRRERESGT
jgi:uncharacterized membrane protein YhaH (DUF805 family)